MVAAVLAACAVLVACGLLLHAASRSRRRSERRLELVLARIDSHLEAISTSVRDTVDRVVELHRDQLQPTPTLDFDAVVDSLVAEAALRTGADAVVLRVEGPGERPIVASLGHEHGEELLERTLVFSPDAAPFRAATIGWTYSPADSPEEGLFHSAIVAPLHATTGIPGMLVAYSTAPDALGPEHGRLLHDLIVRFSTALENARRFADVEARILVDPATGVATARGYEVELDRAVARAQRMQRQLSLLVVSLGPEGADAADGGVDRTTGFARALRRVIRRSDVACRRGDREFAVVLPETAEAGAANVATRLRQEAERALGASSTTVATGLVEWYPGESVEALEARAETALAGHPIDLARAAEARDAEATVVLHAEPTDVLRNDTLRALADDVADARRSGRSLALVVLDVDGLEDISSRLGRDAADATLSDVARRLDGSVGNGSVRRLGPGEFALVLVGATADDAEVLLDALHATDRETEEIGRTTVSAGVTELAEHDDAATVLGRAEHALWQARQSGRRGTIVVALTGRRAPGTE